METKISPNSVASLEIILAQKGYKWTKKYDVGKGICTVTATRDLMGSTIIAANTSRSGLWPAYRRALELILQQLTDYEKAVGKGF